MFGEEAVFGQLHREGEAGLSAEGGEQAVRFLNFYNSFDRFKGERLDVDMVGHRLVSHDGRGVGVDEDDFEPLLFEGAAGLGARVVKFRCLSDDDRAGADDHYFF